MCSSDLADRFPATLDAKDGRLLAITEALGGGAPGRILDAGCGKGRFAAALAERFPSAELWGVDISEAMLRAAPAAIRKRQGSLMNLPFDDNFFDAACCVEALEHSVNPEASIAELCRVVRPGGRLVIVDKNAERRGALRIEPWEQWFRREEVQAWLERFCAAVECRPVAGAGHQKDAGLFLVWQAIRK